MSRRLLFIASLFAMVTLGLMSCENFGTVGAGDFNTVILDPGHGGHDFGGRSVHGWNEKDLALDTALRVEKNLQQHGFHVIMTRTDDTFIPLDERAAISNRTFNSIFVSIHYNWDRGSSGHGVETYYCSPRSERLAENVQTALSHAYSTANRGVKHGCWIRVLRKNTRPAILVEGGFDSNPGENALLQSASGRQHIADAIARGIVAEREGRRL